MNIIDIILFLYILATPVMLYVFFISIKQFKNENGDIPLEHISVSDIGSYKCPTHKLFNRSLIIYGFFGFLFVNAYKELLAPHTYAFEGIGLLMIASLSCILVGLFPKGRSEWLHYIFAFLAFYCMMLAFGFLVLPMVHSPLIPNGLIIFNIIGALLLLLFLVLYTWQKRFLGIKELTYEWVAFSLIIIWNGIMATVLMVSV